MGFYILLTGGSQPAFPRCEDRSKDPKQATGSIPIRLDWGIFDLNQYPMYCELYETD